MHTKDYINSLTHQPTRQAESGQRSRYSHLVTGRCKRFILFSTASRPALGTAQPIQSSGDPFPGSKAMNNSLAVDNTGDCNLHLTFNQLVRLQKKLVTYR